MLKSQDTVFIQKGSQSKYTPGPTSDFRHPSGWGVSISSVVKGIIQYLRIKTKTKAISEKRSKHQFVIQISKRVAFVLLIFLYGRIMFLSEVLHVKCYVKIP